MDALAADGVTFLRHYTQGVDTRRSLPCILFSRYFCVPVFPLGPDFPLARPEDLFRALDEEAVSLPEVFRQAGIKSAGITAHSWTSDDTLFAQEFDEWIDLSSTMKTTATTWYPNAATVVDRAIAWTKDHMDQDFLLYVHLMDSHFPHLFDADAQEFLQGELPSLDRFHPSGMVADPGAELSVEEKAYLDAIYDGSLRYLDRELGRFFVQLEQIGIVDNGLIAITSDHGEALMEKPGLFEHGDLWCEEVARIPFVIVGRKRVPQGRARFLSGNVDLLPTLADCMGIPIPEGKRADGVNLVQYLDGQPPERDYMAADGGIIVGNYKAIFTAPTSRVLGTDDEQAIPNPPGYLYDLESDPGEQRNLREKQPALWAKMLADYREHLRPSYERFCRSIRTTPPERPFAMGALSFRFDDGGPNAGPAIESLAANEGLSDSWFISRDWPDFYLAAKGSAGSIEVSLPLPNGTYAVDLHMAGNCLLSMPGDAEMRVARGRAFDPRNPKRTEPVGVGDVVVIDQRLSITFEKRAEEPVFYLSSIGFTPEGVGELTEDERARIQRLKGLGY
jgi:arylsulfatase A-like enzyme